MLQAMALDLEDELARKKAQEELEEKYGVYIQPPALGAGGAPSITARFKNWRSKKAVADKTEEKVLDDFFTVNASLDNIGYASKKSIEKGEVEIINNTSSYFAQADAKEWAKNITSPYIPSTVFPLLNKIGSSDTYDIATKLFLQGKLYSYNRTGFIPYTDQKNFEDYSDLLVHERIRGWVDAGTDDTYIKACCLSAFCMGQLKGYLEQGINHIRLNNVRNKSASTFDILELQKQDKNLSFLISSKLEVPLFSPGIQADSVAGLVHNLDPQIQPYRTSFVKGVR
jgi:hypothetical protein